MCLTFWRTVSLVTVERALQHISFGPPHLSQRKAPVPMSLKGGFLRVCCCAACALRGKG